MKITIKAAMVLLAIIIWSVASASAQTVRPRKSAPAPAPAVTKAEPVPTAPTPADTPAPAPQPETPKAAEATATGSLVITFTAPASIEASRTAKFDYKVSGGKAPYTVTTTDADPCYANPGDEERAEGTISCTPERDATDFELLVSATDASEPKLEGSKTVNVKVTPRVATMADLDDTLDLTAKGADLNALSRDLTSVAQTNIAITRGRIMEVKQLLQQERARTERSHQKLNWLLRGATIGGLLMICAVLLFYRLGVRVVRMAPAILLIASLGLAHTAYAQTAPTSKITAVAIVHKDGTKVVATNNVLVKEQDAEEIRFTGTSLENVERVEMVDAPAGFTFADVKAGAKQVTANVSADAAALTGPITFRLVNKDGTTIDSGNLYLRVLDLQVADVRSELLAASANKTQLEMMRVFVHGFFVQAYGKDEGEKAYAAFKGKPSYAAMDALVEKLGADTRANGAWISDLQHADAALRSEQTTLKETINTNVKTFNENTLPRLEALERADARQDGAIGAIGAVVIQGNKPAKGSLEALRAELVAKGYLIQVASK